MALLVGVAIASAVLAADLLLGSHIGAPLWTCVSSARPTSTHALPAGDPSIVMIEEVESYSECRDRVGVPLALVAFVTSAAVAYRRASRRRPGTTRAAPTRSSF
jgi:hypothetical protein